MSRTASSGHRVLGGHQVRLLAAALALLLRAGGDLGQLAGGEELPELALHLAREQQAHRIDADGAERFEQLARLRDAERPLLDATDEQLDELVDRTTEVLAQDRGCLRGGLEIDADPPRA